MGLMAFNENFVWEHELHDGRWVEVTPLSRGREVIAIEVRFGDKGVLGSRDIGFSFPFSPDIAAMVAAGMSAVLEAMEIAGGMEEVALQVKVDREQKRREREKNAIRIWSDDFEGVNLDGVDLTSYLKEPNIDKEAWEKSRRERYRGEIRGLFNKAKGEEDDV